jgi:phosphoribosylglycinamide formyltransferase
MAKPKITVLISGNGSNLQAIIDAAEAKDIDAEIVEVISSSSTAYGLERAAKANIPTKVHQLKDYYKDLPKTERPQLRKKFNKDLANLVLYGSVDGEDSDELPKGHTKPDLIVCAGWMLILSNEFLSPLEDEDISIINLHPALPGAFDGTHAIDRAWKAGQDGEITKGGVMIHKVIQQVDAGEPLLVKEVDIVKGETLEQYEEKIHSIEHEAIVEGTKIALKELTKQD